MFKIGDFSRLARVSIKTLRHYDEEHLLTPAHTDRATGYRYYSADQLATLQRILLLKELGFGLSEIRGLLTAPDTQLQLQLRERKRQLEADLARDLARLRTIDALGQSIDSAAATHVSVSLVPAVVVHSVRDVVPHLGEPVERLFESAEQRVAQHRLRADASPFLIFHDEEYNEADVDVEVCIPLKAGELSAIEHRSVPEALCACTTYFGSYDQTWPLQHSVLKWLATTQRTVSGPLREVYHCYGARQHGYHLPAHVITRSSSEYVTELLIPVSN